MTAALPGTREDVNRVCYLSRMKADQETRTRRLFLKDHEWERTHASWKALKPRRNFDVGSPTDETKLQYAERVRIPVEVTSEWLYPHFYNWHTVQNYGWIDYDRVTFVSEGWPFEPLGSLRIYSDFRKLVDQRTEARSLTEFCCIDKDVDHWREAGTWRVPPVILDREGLGEPPPYAEVPARFQLIEGHNRMGYLRAFHRFAPDEVAPTHRVWVMKAKA